MTKRIEGPGDEEKARADRLREALSRHIAKDLFTAGPGEHAERLKLINAQGRDLGGWSEQAARDCIFLSLGDSAALREILQDQ